MNTGAKSGVIRYTEIEFNRPLQRLICQFRAKELPLRHLCKHLEGITADPTEYSETIGKMIEKRKQFLWYHSATLFVSYTK